MNEWWEKISATWPGWAQVWAARALSLFAGVLAAVVIHNVI